MNSVNTETLPVRPAYRICKVNNSAPFDWVKKGIHDVKTAPLPSLLYGLLFALIGLLLLFLASNNPIWSASIISAFFLVGPFLAVGLYHISQQIEAGDKPCLLDSLSAIGKNAKQLGLFVVVLGFIIMIWMRIAALVAGIYFDNIDLIAKGWSVLLDSSQSVEFLLFFTVFGFLIANLAYSISVVAIPMIIHRQVDVLTAIITSLRAVIKNPIPLLIWAILIVVFIHLGFFALFIGVAVSFPIIGHASWHAYRDLVIDNKVAETIENN
jgi:uncharacterized membrane protein